MHAAPLLFAEQLTRCKELREIAAKKDRVCGSSRCCTLPQKERRKENSPSPNMLSKLGQSFNSAGIASALHVVFREPQTALPHLSVPDIRDIDWQSLSDLGFQGVVLDKDNTLTAPYSQTLWPPLAASLDDCRKVFNGKIALLSNSAGLYQYDPDEREAEMIEEVLKVPVIRHGYKKPSGTPQELIKHFGCDPGLLVMVGDRYFTDIVYGNKLGLLTCITKPLTLDGEPMVIRQVRALEEFLVHRWLEKGITPTKHKLLLPRNHQFVRDPQK